jgi:hypothetical protein
MCFWLYIYIVLLVFDGTFETGLDQGCQHNTVIQIQVTVLTMHGKADYI